MRDRVMQLIFVVGIVLIVGIVIGHVATDAVESAAQIQAAIYR